MVALVLMGLLPLGLGLFTSYLSQRSILTQTMGSAFQGLAKETSTKLGLWIEGLVSRTTSVAGNPILHGALLVSNASYSPGSDIERHLVNLEERWVRMDRDSRNAFLQSEPSQFLKKAVEASEDRFAQIMLVDRQGGLVAAAGPSSHYRFRDENWWQAAYNHGQGAMYVGDIGWDSEIKRYTLPLAVPVGVEGEIRGVLLAVHAVDQLFKSVTSVHIGGSDHTMLANSNGELLFCPIFFIKRHSLNHDLIELISKPEPGWVVSRFDVHYPGRDAVNGFSQVSFNISNLSRDSLGVIVGIFSQARTLRKPTGL